MPDKPGTPFVILALPRSRTAWLTKFLSHGGYEVAHEQARHGRSADDVRRWLSQDWTGVADTAAAAHWRLIRHYRPDVRILVVRRPIEMVLDSMKAAGPELNEDRLRVYLRALDRRLDLIEHRLSGVLSVRFVDLDDEATCRRVYQHCLGLPFDAAWWSTWAAINVQADLFAMARHFAAHREPLEKFAADCKRRTLALLYRGGARPAGEVTIQEEPSDAVWPVVQRLKVLHEAAAGPRNGAALDFNEPLARQIEAMGNLLIVTARCGGRLVGYLVSVISRSMEDRSLVVAAQTGFFAAPGFRGLGPRLAAASEDALRARGVGEVLWRAGLRGSGPKIGALARRMGAVENGQLYSHILETA